jgi:trigger factor
MAESEPTTSVADVGELKKCLEVEVPASVVAAGLDRAFKDLQQRVRIRGFRPGKAPRTVLERLYGQQVRGEVIQELVREAYSFALSRHNVQAVAAPEIVVQPLGEEHVLRFSATVEVYPQVTVSDCEGIEVTRPLTSVDDQDVDKVLARMAEAAATIHPVTDRERVEEGDVVTADISATIDGRPVGEMSRKALRIEAGKGTFPGALEEKLVGLSTGTTTVDVDYPSGYPNAAFAGKRVSLTVTLTAVGRKEIPLLDDEFARKHGDCQSIDALRDKIRSSLERNAERDADTAVREAVLDVLIERHPFDAPEAMIERRCEAMLESLNVRLPSGPDGQKALGTLLQELRPRAVRDGKVAILLDSLAGQHDLEVGDDELTERIDRIVEEAGEARGRARELYRSDEHRKALRTQMLREKALALVVDKSSVRTAEKR